jgi:hypothetical protein
MAETGFEGSQYKGQIRQRQGKRGFIITGSLSQMEILGLADGI